jgi:hypothetical protein
MRSDSTILRVSRKGRESSRCRSEAQSSFPVRSLLNNIPEMRVRRTFAVQEEGVMSLVRLLGFNTLACGCVVGRYREVATSREISYVEEKGKSCGSHGHRRNHTVSTERLASASPIALASKAS